MNDFIASLYDFDFEIRREYPVFCGVDEAGRGPLAGDVFASAVILSPQTQIEGLNDSKKLSAKKRDALFDEIMEKAVAYSIASATVEEIEELNILGASLLAMKRAVEALKTPAGFAAIDGNRLPVLDIPAKAFVSGDARSASIAAASVLAKVARDRYMLGIHQKFPFYHFDKHKGYGTALHYQMLDEFGASEVHRQSFLKKYYASKK